MKNVKFNIIKIRTGCQCCKILSLPLKSQLGRGLDIEQWFLTCGEFPTGGEWRSCQVGNDRSDSWTTASKFNTSHPNVDLLYKSQPFTEEMGSWPTKKWGIGEKRSRTPAIEGLKYLTKHGSDRIKDQVCHLVSAFLCRFTCRVNFRKFQIFSYFWCVNVDKAK